MLIYDSNQKLHNPPETAALETYLKGVFDAEEFNEEDHPRAGKGERGGGQFKKSNKTIEKEDDLGSPDEKTANSDSGNSGGDKNISASVAAMALADKAGRGGDSTLISKIEKQIHRLCNPNDESWKTNSGTLVDPQATRKRQASDLVKRLTDMQKESGHHQFNSVIEALNKSLD